MKRMTDLINGKTPEAIKAALCICTHGGCAKYNCAYEADGDCSGSVMSDALELIDRLEMQVKRRDELLRIMGVSLGEE